MRVLLVIGQLGLGGTERQVVLLASALSQRGVEVHVASLYGGGPQEDELRRLGIPVWVGAVPSKVHVLRLCTSLLSFFRLLRRFRPDVLHAFLLHAYVLAGPLARIARVPVVVAGRRSLGDSLRDRPILRAIERLTTPTYDAVVANAEAVAEDTRNRERVAPSKLMVVPNALPDSSFLDERNPERSWADPPTVLCVANLIAYKGHRDLLMAASELDVDVRLQLVGDGPERPALEADAARLGTQVEFLGLRQDVAHLLTGADAFVLASHEEGMSNALMEAMAAGLPCVATDVGGNAEVLDDCGVLCRPRDPVDLARALAEVLSDERAAKELGLRARRRAEATFRTDRLATAHHELYCRLLEGRSCLA